MLESKMNEDLQNIITVLEDLKEDPTMPKNVKIKIQNAISELKNNKEKNVAIHKALNELDDLADNSSMDSFIRSQIFNIISVLESLSI